MLIAVIVVAAFIVMGETADVAAQTWSVRAACHDAGLSDEVISELEEADLLALHGGGYKTAFRMKNATRDGLGACGLNPAVVDVLTTALGQLGEFGSRLPPETGNEHSTLLSPQFPACAHIPFSLPCLCFCMPVPCSNLHYSYMHPSQSPRRATMHLMSSM